MILDLRTIYVVSAMTLLVLGGVHLATYATGRFGRWPGWWGASYLVLGFGTLFVSLRGVIPYAVSIQAGNVLTIAGYLLTFFAVRVFAGRPAPSHVCGLVLACASLPVLLLPSGDMSVSTRLFYVSAICCLCDLAVLRESFGIHRRERLFSAGLMAWLYLPTTAIFLVRTLMAATGEISGPDPYGATMVHNWMASTAVVFVALRSMVIVLMAAERSHNQLTEVAHRDPLTQALNRGGLTQSFAALGAQPVSLLVFDVDHFKELNDTHGHAAGDAILQLFARVAGVELRTGDLLARQGGDEFVAVLRDTSRGNALLVAERIRLAFRDSVREMPDLQTFPTLSIGVSVRQSGDVDLEMLLHRADEALYYSKRKGRDRVEACAESEQAA